MGARSLTKHDGFSSVIIFLFALVETVKYFSAISTTTANVVGVLLGAVSIIYVFLRKGIRPQRRIITFFLIYTFFGFFSYLINHNMQLRELLWPVFYWGLAILLLNERPSPVVARISFYLFAIVSIFAILRAGRIYNLQTAESRNYCSVYLICLFSIYIITIRKNGTNDFPIIETIITCLVSVLSLGRGGIVSSCVLMLLFFLYRIKRKHRNITIMNQRRVKSLFIPFLIIVGLVFVCWFMGFFPKIIEGIDYSIEYFKIRGLNGSRNKIWSDYFNEIIRTPISLLFAPRIQGTETLDNYSFNLHNSYLMLYARYGTIVFFYAIILLIKRINNYRKKDFLLFSILIVIGTRIFTDVVAFNGVLDVPLIYLLFYNRKLSVETGVLSGIRL